MSDHTESAIASDTRKVRVTWTEEIIYENVVDIPATLLDTAEDGTVLGVSEPVFNDYMYDKCLFDGMVRDVTLREITDVKAEGAVTAVKGSNSAAGSVSGATDDTRNITVVGRGRTEAVTEYEAQCLRAGFLARDIGNGLLAVPAGEPVGTGPERVTHWDLIDRLLTKIRMDG